MGFRAWYKENQHHMRAIGCIASTAVNLNALRRACLHLGNKRLVSFWHADFSTKLDEYIFIVQMSDYTLSYSLLL